MIKYGLDTEKVYTNNSGYKFRVIEFVNASKVKVAFDSGYEDFFTAGNIRNLTIKDRLSPSVFGFGVNDLYYSDCHPDEVSVQLWHIWKNMIQSCYCPIKLKEKPTHELWSVSQDWVRFSDFLKWACKQDWEGKILSRGVKSPSNNIFSPENCAFVSHDVSRLLKYNLSEEGFIPKGFSFQCGKWKSQISINGKTKIIGTFDTKLEAHKAYCKAKSEYMRKVSETQEPIVKAALIRNSKKLEKESSTQKYRGN